MAGIAGISEPGKQTQVNKMVEKISKRGKDHKKNHRNAICNHAVNMVR